MNEAEPKQASLMRYQIFTTRHHGFPVVSAPWKWMAYGVAALLANWHEWVDLVDSETGKHLMGWVTWRTPIVLGGPTEAAQEHIMIKPDGSTHTLPFGTKGQDQRTVITIEYLVNGKTASND